MEICGEKLPKIYIRHKKAPEWDEKFKSYSISFYQLIDNLDLEPQRYYKLLEKILLDTKTIHFASLLSKEDLLYLKKLVYTLAIYGFRFINIEYLSLYGLGAKRVAKWAKEYNNGKDIEQKDIVIGIYSTLITKEDFRKIQDKEKIKEYIGNILDEKIVMFSSNNKPIHFTDTKKVGSSSRKKIKIDFLHKPDSESSSG